MPLASLMHSALASVLTLALAVGPAEFLSDPDAQRLFGEGQQAYAAEDFAGAADRFEAAYDIEAAPELLYAWAQAERSAGDCARAIEIYQKLIDQAPKGKLAAAAQGNIERCQDTIEAEAAAAEEASDEETDALDEQDDEELDVVEDVLSEEPPPTTTDDSGSMKDEPPKTKRWYRDPVGGVLVGLGVAGVAAGAGLTGYASSVAKSAGDADTNTAYLDERDRATKLRNGGAAALAIGGALVVAGVIRYALLARKQKRAASDVAVWFGRGGAGLGWTGRF